MRGCGGVFTLHEIYYTTMSNTFQKHLVHKGGLTAFRFEVLYAGNESIYAVYCDYKEKTYCFHMLLDNMLSKFIIVDKHNCPFDLLKLESTLSESIFFYLL